MKFISTNVCLALLPGIAGLVLIGCGQDKKTGSSGQSKSTYDASAFLATTEIEGAKDVVVAKKDSKDKEEIVVVGRIGGSIDPWVKGRAAFSIVDRSLKACSDHTEDGEDCGCPTPWDYCCDTDKLKDSMVLIKFVEPDGKIVKHDAREIFPIKELQTVIVRGKAQRDDSGNLTVLATSMFVKK